MEFRKLKNYEVTCLDCGSKLIFYDEDIFDKPHKDVMWGFVVCPNCGKEIHVRYERDFCDKVNFKHFSPNESEGNIMTNLENNTYNDLEVKYDEVFRLSELLEKRCNNFEFKYNCILNELRDIKEYLKSLEEETEEEVPLESLFPEYHNTEEDEDEEEEEEDSAPLRCLTSGVCVSIYDLDFTDSSKLSYRDNEGNCEETTVGEALQNAPEEVKEKILSLKKSRELDKLVEEARNRVKVDTLEEVPLKLYSVKTKGSYVYEDHFEAIRKIVNNVKNEKSINNVLIVLTEPRYKGKCNPCALYEKLFNEFVELDIKLLVDEDYFKNTQYDIYESSFMITESNIIKVSNVKNNFKTFENMCDLVIMDF